MRLKRKKGTKNVQYFQQIHDVFSDFRHLRFKKKKIIHNLYLAH